MATRAGCMRKCAIAALVLSWFSVGIFNMYPVFILYKPDFSCRSPDAQNSSLAFGHDDFRFQNNGSLSTSTDVQKCYQRTNLSSATENKTRVACSRGWVYNQPKRHRSAVTEFDLVCERNWIKPLISSLLMVGMMLGSMLGGVVSDRYGRKPAYTAGLVGNLLCALSLALSPSVIMIAIVTCAGGVFNVMRLTPSTVLLQESAPSRYRAMLLLMQMSTFSIGYATLPLFSYLFPDWRHLMYALAFVSLCTGAPAVLVAPESRKWLAAQSLRLNNNQATGGEDAIQLHLEDSEDAPVTRHAKDGKKEQNATILTMLRRRFLLRRLAILLLAWFSVPFCAFGINYNTDNLGGNRYINAALSASAEICGDLGLFAVTRKIGYRSAFTLLSTSSGLMLLISPFAKAYSHAVGIAFAITGKVLVSSCYSLLYVCTGEHVPTSVRNQTMGICSVSARISLTIMPFVIYLGETVYEALPYFFMTGTLILSGTFFLLLPETKNHKLPETVADSKLQERNRLRIQCSGEKRKSFDADDS